MWKISTESVQRFHGMSMGCDIFPFSALTLLVGDRKGIRSVKKLDVGLLVVMI